MAKDLIAFIVEQYRLRGPIFRIRALSQEFVVMAGPEANTFVTQKGGELFSSYETWNPYGREFGAEHSVQDIDGEPHMRMRKLLKRSYSHGMLLSDIPMLVEIAQNVLSRYQVGDEVAALHLMRLIVTEQLGRALTGHAPGYELSAITAAIRTGLKVYVTKQSPAFMLRLPSYKRAKRRFLEIGRDIVAEHRSTTREHPDLVDDLLNAKQDGRFDDVLGHEEELIYGSLGPFVAGLDTVANECTFMLYALLQHPDIMMQCVEEADALFATGLPTSPQLRSQGVLHHAMMETLRLYSIAPAMTRTAAKDFEFAGYSVKRGQKLILASTASHFLSELFPQPSMFDIERYDESRKEHKQRGAYAPFGIGTHTCLGAGAAEAQIVLVMASLLHMVRLEQVNPKTKLRVKNDPTPTFGNTFRVRIVERRTQGVMN